MLYKAEDIKQNNKGIRSEAKEQNFTPSSPDQSRPREVQNSLINLS